MNYKQYLLDEIKKEGIKNKNQVAMILAQCQVESMNFTRIEESFAYHATTLHSSKKKYFPTLSSAIKAISLGKEHIANTVYCNRMGNGNYASGDGWKYRGRGLVQLTGKSNYVACMKGIDLDLITNPDLLLIPENAAKSAIWYFKNRVGFMSSAWNGDVVTCTKLVNGGNSALAERARAFDEWVKTI